MNLNTNKKNYALIEKYNFTIKDMQKWLDDNILMYLTHNEGKSVVAERFIRTLKVKFYKKRQIMIVNLILFF